MPFFVRLISPQYGTIRDYHHCTTCSSITVISDIPGDKAPQKNWDAAGTVTAETLSPSALLGQRHMIELGTNFTVQTFASTQVCRPPPKRLLDIGCGLGIGLDYASHAFSCEVVGIDPGLLALRSAEALGFPLIRGYFPHVDAGLGAPFDCIEGWEVIEHIDAPMDFLEAARESLIEGGLLALSTPNADTINRDTAPSVLLSALSPGEHRIVFSPRGLSALLTRAGFPATCLLQDKRGHFFTLSLRDASEPPSLRPPEDSLLTYCRERSVEMAHDAHFSAGFLTKLTVAYLAGGDWPDLRKTLAGADQMLKAHWGIDLEDRPGIRARLARTEGDRYLTNVPLPLPLLLFAQGRLLQATDSDQKAARDYMNLASLWGQQVVEALEQVGNSDQILLNITQRATAIAAA